MILLRNKQTPEAESPRSKHLLFSLVDLQVSYNLPDFSWTRLDSTSDYKLDSGPLCLSHPETNGDAG